MGGGERGRADRVRMIGELVQRIGWSADRIGHAFAAQQHLHPTDFRALSAIYRGELAGAPLTPRTLRAELDVSPAATTYAVDRLVASGHVVRERDPADGRRVLLRYAQAGLDVAAGFFGPLGLAHSQALDGFGENELKAAAEVLQEIDRALVGFEHRLRGGQRC